MSFLSSIFLVGIIGAGIPVFIHLYNRKKAVTYKFAAIDFIFQSQKRALGGSRLKNLILLALRSLIVAFLAIAVAKPYLIDNAGGVSGLHNSSVIPTSNVFIMDDSFSMSFEIEGNLLFDLAREKAKDMILSFGAIDEVAVLFNSGADSDKLPQLSVDKEFAKIVLDETYLSYTAGNMWKCLESANSILSTSKNDVKRVFIFTDLAKNGWITEAERGENRKLNAKTEYNIDRQTSIHVIDVAGSDKLENICIESVEIDENRDQNGLDISVVAANYSKKEISNAIAKIYIGEKLFAQGFVNMKPGAKATKVFFYKPEGNGPIKCQAEIEPPHDSLAGKLPVDNVYYFIINDRKDVNALIVDGDPGVNIFTSETFYLEKALVAGPQSSYNLKPFVVNAPEFEDAELEKYDLVALCNVESLSDSKIYELERYLVKGGAVLFTLGDKVKTEYYNDSLYKILPAGLRNVNAMDATSSANKIGGAGRGVGQAFSVASFKKPEESNIFYDIFSSIGKDDLNQIEVYRIFQVEPESAVGAKPNAIRGMSSVILSYSNNLPSIIARKHGLGRVAMFTSTIDREWNNITVRPIFLPLVQEICRGLTSKSYFDEYETNIAVNSARNFPAYFFSGLVKQDIGAGRIIRPDRKTEMLRGYSAESKGGIVYTNVDLPGVFTLEDKTKPDLKQPVFAANVETRKESNPARIEKEALTKLLGENVVSFVSDVDGSGLLYGTGIKRGLWGVALFLVLCFFCAEAVILRFR